MTVTATNRKEQFTTNGVTTEFTFTFAITDTSQVYAYTVLDGVETEYTDFTVIASDDVEGGTLTTNSTLSGVDLLIYRDVALTQQVDYESGGRFPADSHEQALDKLTLQNQDQEEELGRAVKVDISQDEVYTIGLLEDGKFLTLNGSVIESSSDTEIQDIINELIKTAIAASTRSDAIAFEDGVYDYTISGFNASISSYYIYHPDGAFNTQILIPDLDYTYGSEDTETITLSSSWSGGYLIARVLDPEGTGTYTPPSQYTSSEIVSKTGLQGGTEITISDLGYSKFVISDTANALAGDITLDSGQVAVLQPVEGKFNVKWFSGADETGSSVSDDAFESAAIRSLAYATENTAASIGGVVVPAGLWNLSQATENKAVWFLELGSEMANPSNVSTSNIDNTSYLTGKKIHYASRGSNFFHVGDTDPWIEGYRFASNSIATMSVTADDGRAAIYGHSRASDRTSQGAGCIGVGATAWADQTEDFDFSVWAGYFEAGKFYDVTGNAFAIESNVTNFTGAIQELTPDLLPQGSDKYSVNLWTGGPVGDSGTDTPDDDNIYPSTAAMVVATGGKPYGNGGFDKGIIFLEASFLNGSKEILAYSAGHRMMAYSSTGVKLSYLETEEDSTDNVGVINHRVKLANGSWVLYRMGTTQFACDNEANLGGTDNRWSTGYFINSPNVSSDETLKELRDDSGSLSAGEKKAAIAIAKLPRMFKWLSEIEEKKGTDETVYLHCSPMAQKVWAALVNEGLDPTSYGFIDDGGEDSTMSLQPQEILWMICAAQQEQIEDIQTRLIALEG